MEKRKLKYVSTWYEGNRRCRQEKEVEFMPDGGEEDGLLNLYPSVTYQTFEGFGGALTEAAGHVYGQMKQEQKREMLREYFEPDLNWVRKGTSHFCGFLFLFLFFFCFILLI